MRRTAMTLAVLVVLTAPAVGRAEGADGGAPPADRGAAPDPEPTLTNREILLDLAWEKGVPVLVKATPQTLPAPRKAGRWMGRFALELSEGPALLERLRFNFPLLHEPPPHRADYKAPPSFENGLTTTVRVVFPHLDRGSRFELFDRATGRRWALPWPLDAERARTALPLVTAPARAQPAPKRESDR